MTLCHVASRRVASRRVASSCPRVLLRAVPCPPVPSPPVPSRPLPSRPLPPRPVPSRPVHAIGAAAPGGSQELRARREGRQCRVGLSVGLSARRGGGRERLRGGAGRAYSIAASLHTRIIPAKIRRLNISGEFPLGLGIPPLNLRFCTLK